MTSSNSLKKLVSIGAVAILSLGANLVHSEVAFAATSITWDAGAGATMDDSGQQTYVQSAVTGNNIASAPAATKSGCTVSQWQEWRNGSMFSNVNFPYAPYGATLDLRALWSCPNTFTAAPTATLSGGSIVVTPGTWATAPSDGNWRICGQSVASGSSTNGYFNGNAAGCDWLNTTSMGMTRVTSRTLNLSSTYYISGNRTAVLAGSYLVWVELGGGTQSLPAFYANTASIHVTQSDIAAGQSSSPATPTVVSEAAKPLPVWAAPILKQIPTLSKTLTTDGGKIALKDGDYSSLKSVTVGGKEVAYSVDAKGDVNIPVPAGKGGTTADLVVVFDGGKMTVQDGIKYVAPTDVSKVTERPIAIAAGAKKLTEAVADQIRQAAFANMTNTNVQCVAYAANNSAAAKAAAKLTAVQACGIAAASNPALKVAEVSVIVNKAKAKTTAVGIKVYK